MVRRVFATTALIVLGAALVRAQWPAFTDPNIPRTAEGRLDLSAKVPRGPDGRPDMSGVWVLDKTPFRYLQNMAADFAPGDVPMQPWAESLTRERASGVRASEFPPSRCLPQGIPILDNSSAAGYPLKLVHKPNLLVMLYEANSQFRQVYLDGRPLPRDPNPTWLGYSVGRWENDTLVIETAGFNGKSWLDLLGHPSTDALRTVERLHRANVGHLQVQLTVDDAVTYQKPFTVTLEMRLVPDTDLLEYVCNENERDQEHIGKR